MSKFVFPIKQFNLSIVLLLVKVLTQQSVRILGSTHHSGNVVLCSLGRHDRGSELFRQYSRPVNFLEKGMLLDAFNSAVLAVAQPFARDLVGESEQETFKIFGEIALQWEVFEPNVIGHLV